MERVIGRSCVRGAVLPFLPGTALTLDGGAGLALLLEPALLLALHLVRVRVRVRIRVRVKVRVTVRVRVRVSICSPSTFAALFDSPVSRARSSALAPPTEIWGPSPILEKLRTPTVAGTASRGSGGDGGAGDSCDEAAAAEGCLPSSATD